MGLTARVDGAERLASTLGTAARDLEDLDQVNDQVGALVLGAVRPPRITGALANTIREEPDRSGVTITAGSSSVPYAGVIHGGWPRHHIRAQPFISDAVLRTESRIADKYEDRVTDVLSQVKGA